MTAPKPVLVTSLTPTAPRFVDRSEWQTLEEQARDCIAERARRIYEESGRQAGNDDSNWLRAESEVLRRDLEVSESGSWVRVDATLPGFSAEDVQICVDSARVMVKAEKLFSPNGFLERNSVSPGRSLDGGRLRQGEHAASHGEEARTLGRVHPLLLSLRRGRSFFPYTLPCMGDGVQILLYL